MDRVTCDKTELLTILKKNREDHRSIFLEAQKGYREEAIKQLDRMIADAKSGKKIRRTLTLIEPQNQTRDYDRVIRMLEMSTIDQITLSEREFSQYVLDDWNWKQQFLHSNRDYSMKAAELSAQLPDDE